jgi:hypothetical protein
LCAALHLKATVLLVITGIAGSFLAPNAGVSILFHTFLPHLIDAPFMSSSQLRDSDYCSPYCRNQLLHAFSIYGSIFNDNASATASSLRQQQLIDSSTVHLPLQP